MAFLISLSYKINALIGGDSVNLNNNYSKEGVMTFMDRAENLNSKVLDMFCDTDNNKKKDGIKPVECMEKFCSEKWIDFFRDNISSKIKLYEEQLCQMKEDDDSLFDNANDNDETEDLLGKYKSRDEELFEDINKNEDNEDLVINDFNDNYEINKNDKEMAKFKDMEINLNEFNFIDENENKKEEDDINNENNNENHFDKKENVDIIKIDKIYN